MGKEGGSKAQQGQASQEGQGGKGMAAEPKRFDTRQELVANMEVTHMLVAACIAPCKLGECRQMTRAEHSKSGGLWGRK